MEKRTTTSVTYNLPINDFDCAKNVLSELHELRKKMKKSEFWEHFIMHQIKNCGLRIVFIHLWNTDDQWFDGQHYEEEMVFETFIGFNSIGTDLYSMGELAVKDVDILCEKYEKNPDFIFTQLDWDAPKEEVIRWLISDLMEGDFATD